ncbi:MAG TPA: sigma-70 family RNA polymerase sigma factor [Planctomycetota bacterium]|nr:sigma-70 family RNA polymerase sigma factor [Planctomycetota bacterium]
MDLDPAIRDDDHDPAAAAAPDEAAMQALLAERGLLLAYINVIVRDLHASEDLLQEALVLAMRQRFAGVDHARGWIRVTARNLSLNHVRRADRRRRVSDETLAQLESAWSEEAAGPSHGQRLAALRACSERLSPAAKRMLELRFVDGLACDAVATALRKPVNTVYVGMSRLYARLAKCIDQRLRGA